jgi:RNA polymerase sigma-70 factor (ECF subfamily)
MSYAEIADELDLPLGTVKARIHQARKQVAERLTVR